LIPGLTPGSSKLHAAASELKRLGASTARAEGVAGTVLGELRALPSKQALGLRAEVAGKDFHPLPLHLFISTYLREQLVSQPITVHQISVHVTRQYGV
jgi:hypothetical protein